MLARRSTNALLEMIEEGSLSKDALIFACLHYMSEAEVAVMAYSEGFLTDEEDEEDQG